MKITPAKRQQGLNRIIKVIRMSGPYEKILAAERSKEVKKVMSALLGLPVNLVPDLIQVREQYLASFFRKLYLNIGPQVAGDEFREKIGQKNDRSIGWERGLYDFLEQYSGTKISMVSGTLKEWIVKQVQEYVTLMQHEGQSIETVTRNMRDVVVKKWNTAELWQVRRIVQFESLACSSVARQLSIDSLGVEYTKTWMISGHNTRPGHQVMDGVTVGQQEYFYPEGEKMEYPRDIRFGASAGNLINCMCSVVYNVV